MNYPVWTRFELFNLLKTELLLFYIIFLLILIFFFDFDFEKKFYKMFLLELCIEASSLEDVSLVMKDGDVSSAIILNENGLKIKLQKPDWNSGRLLIHRTFRSRQ